MSTWRRWAGGCILAIVLVPCAAIAQDATPRPAIPFKTEPSPVEEYGGRLAAVLVVLAGLAGAVVYLAKKRIPSWPGLSLRGKRLQVVERVRLNPRCALYLVKVDDKEVLLGQCGDNLVPVEGSVGPGREAS
jgi:flagellar biogenesis protein FliO